MKRVLIVSPHFPPTNAADMHRVRMLLPFLRGNGWEAEVLVVAPESVAAPRDEWMAAGLPEDVPVHRVHGLGLGWCRVPGFGTLGWRALPAVCRKGAELLAGGGFDLVYFSTTQWPVHLAGPRWRRKFGLPFALDYQDPWVNDYYREHPEVTPPGGKLRYAAAGMLNRLIEPGVLRQCAGYTAVSSAYAAQLKKRYVWAANIPDLLLPFPGSVRDFERVRQGTMAQTHFDPGDGNRHWVYVGRGGRDMEVAARILFQALKFHAQDHAEFVRTLRLHFIGTSYAPAGQGEPTIAPLAAEYGLQDVVFEKPDRIAYGETLRCLLDASALIALCSNDRAYTASKIHPYVLARRPLLAICHEESGVTKLMDGTGGGCCVTFAGDHDVASAARRVLVQWLESGAFANIQPLDPAGLSGNTDSESARVLTAWWSTLIASKAGPG
jgi:hypothetical protein